MPSFGIGDLLGEVGYALNPLNWFNGDFIGNSPYQKKMDAEKAQFDLEQYNQNTTKAFQDLFNSGSATSNDYLNFVLQNADWAKENGDFINPIIQSQMNRDNMSKDLQAQMQAFKDNGINPLNVTGNLGSLGSSNLDIAPAQQAQQNGANGLGDLKNLLAIGLLIAKLVAM